MADRLAQQGLNVVLVALDDALLEKTYADLKAKYPSITIRKVMIAAKASRHLAAAVSL